MCCDSEMPSTWNESVKTQDKYDSDVQTAQKQKKKGKGPRGPVTAKLPKFETLEDKANFMMYEFKVKLCTRKRRHTWSGCPYAHRGETARRRDPHTHHAVPCPEMKKGNRCPRGDRCCYSHHDFEYWLHPARYCTVMCNKGTACDRALCFFAHTPEELRYCPANRDAPPNNDHWMTDQFSDSSSSGHNSFDKIVLNADDTKSCGSNSSLPESLQSVLGKHEEAQRRTDSSILKTSLQECQHAVFSSDVSSNATFTRSNVSTMKENSEPQIVNPFSTKECIDCSNIVQLLHQPNGSSTILDYSVSSESEGTKELLRSKYYSNSASHLSPTCHFSGSAQEFIHQATPNAATPVSSNSFGLTTRGSTGLSLGAYKWMQNEKSCNLGTMDCPSVDIKHLEMLAAAQMSAAAQAFGQDMAHNQAMDYFRSLIQSTSNQTRTHPCIASSSSSPSVFCDPSSRDLLSNVDSLQLFKLHLLCKMQGGGVITPSSTVSPSLLNPQSSFEEAISKDALYSLQEHRSLHNMTPYSPNHLQKTGVNIAHYF